MVLVAYQQGLPNSRARFAGSGRAPLAFTFSETNSERCGGSSGESDSDAGIAAERPAVIREARRP